MRHVFSWLLIVALALLLPATHARTTAIHFRSSSLTNIPPGDPLKDIDIIDIKEQAQLEVSDLLRATIQRRADPKASDPEPGPLCKVCVGAVAKHLMQSYWAKIEQQCHDCCKERCKKRCQWIFDHREQMSGYLAALTRPGHDGFTYCMGMGVCPHPPSSAELLGDEMLFTRNLNLTTDTRQGENHIPQVTQEDGWIAEQMEAAAVRVEMGVEEFEPSGRCKSRRPLYPPIPHNSIRPTLLGGPGHLPPMLRESNDTCHECLRNVTRCVLRQAIKHLEKVCKKTTCPKMKEFCKWAQTHRPFVSGMLYAQVTPWRYAVGYCCGSGDCGKNETTIGDNVMEGGTVSIAAAEAVQLQHEPRITLTDDEWRSRVIGGGGRIVRPRPIPFRPHPYPAPSHQPRREEEPTEVTILPYPTPAQAQPEIAPIEAEIVAEEEEEGTEDKKEKEEKEKKKKKSGPWKFVHKAEKKLKKWIKKIFKNKKKEAHK